MKKYLVRFLLVGPHTMDVFMDENQARETVKQWRDGKFNPDSGCIGGWDVEQGREWAISLANVIGVFCFDYMEAAKRMEAEQRLANLSQNPR